MFLLTSCTFSRIASAWFRFGVVAAAILVMTTAAPSGAQSSASGLPPTFDPLLQGPANAEFRQLASQLFDGAGFGRLSSGERETLNTKLTAALRSKGSSLGTTSPINPEADYQMALVFLLDMERIAKMGSAAERNAVLNAYPGKVKEYLTKYLARAPTGRYAARAKELLKAAGGN
jgi:hypothetical protein